MVCACSAQHADAHLQRKLQHDLGEPTQALAATFHNAARELHSVIPVGNNHLLNVQSLLHSYYWYQSEARFVECWHVLGAAVREVQELGRSRRPPPPAPPLLTVARHPPGARVGAHARV